MVTRWKGRGRGKAGCSMVREREREGHKEEMGGEKKAIRIDTTDAGMSGRKGLSGRKNMCICLLDVETIFVFLHAHLT